MSCLQSRSQAAAFDELAGYGADGIQLTPGNLPSPGFRERAESYEGVIRFHHGFAWDRYRRRIFDDAFRPIDIARDHSVHPPSSSVPPRRRTMAAPPSPRPEQAIARPDPAAWLALAAEEYLLVETMYPGEILGTGAEIEAALDLGLRLAVDVSHLHIQRTQGALSEATQARLLSSDLVEEIHVSANDGARDQHRALREGAYLVDWARERSAHLPVVLESYWHRATESDRQRQLAVLWG